MIILILLGIEATYWYHQYIKEDNIVVAVIDTGVEFKNKNLKGKEIYPVNLVKFNWNAGDTDGHGTHVAGIINHLAPHSKIMPIKMIPSGKKTSMTVPAGIAVLYSVVRGADVVNMSFAQMEEDPITKLSIWYGRQHGVIFTAATGNEGVDFTGYPASIPGVISVAGVYDDNSFFEYSNLGKDTRFAAPGVEVKSINNRPKNKRDEYVTKTGTSMATGHVSGVIAYLLEKHPNWKQDEIEQYLQRMSYPVTDGKKRDVSHVKAIAYQKIQANEEGTPYLHVDSSAEVTKESTATLTIDTLHNRSLTLQDGKGQRDIPNQPQTVQVSLKEGYNNIQVKAMKDSTHTFVDSKRILKDTGKPKIEYLFSQKKQNKDTHLFYIEDYNVEKVEVNGVDQTNRVMTYIQNHDDIEKYVLSTDINAFPLRIKVCDKAGNIEEMTVERPKF